jgi:hypothetical protein
LLFDDLFSSVFADEDGMLLLFSVEVSLVDAIRAIRIRSAEFLLEIFQQNRLDLQCGRKAFVVGSMIGATSTTDKTRESHRRRAPLSTNGKRDSSCYLFSHPSMDAH